MELPKEERNATANRDGVRCYRETCDTQQFLITFLSFGFELFR